MSNPSPRALVPSRDPATIYFLEIDYGKLGRSFAPTPSICTEADTVASIIAGEFDRIQRVVAANPSEGWSRDVTEDIGRMVWAQVSAGDLTEMSAAARELVERVGFDVQAALDAQEAAAREWQRHEPAFAPSIQTHI